MLPLANFEIVWEETDDKVLTLRDIGPWNLYMTITNNAEGVVEFLHEFLGNRRLFYYDSDGQKDEIIHVDGKFSNFSPIA